MNRKLLLERHNLSDHCRINNPNSIGSVADHTQIRLLKSIYYWILKGFNF